VDATRCRSGTTSRCVVLFSLSPRRLIFPAVLPSSGLKCAHS
jgi:hypothetical protein